MTRALQPMVGSRKTAPKPSPDKDAALQRKLNKVQRQQEELKTKGAGASNQEKVAQPAYLQAKMAVSTPGDAQEQEADRTAEQVSRMPRAAARQADEQVQRASLKPGLDEGEPEVLDQSVQASRAEEENVQPLLRTKTDEVQREESEPGDVASEGQTIAVETEQKIEALRGQGNPLPEDVRRDMEEKLGADFSSVSIHTTDEADALCRDLGARAFTVGSDIFFAAGEYAPETEAGRKLLAHELTHVVQQGAGASRKVFRQEGTAEASTTEYRVTSGDYAGTMINTATNRLEISKISLPGFKGERHRSKFVPPLRLSSRGSTSQRDNWTTEVSAEVEEQVESMTDEVATAGGINDTGDYFFYGKNNSEFILFGNESTLKENLIFPFWDSRAQGYTFQVDHIVERQLGGIDDPSNYELLEASANMSSGSRIHSQIDDRIRGALGALREENAGNTNIPRPSRLDYVKNNYQLDNPSAEKGIIFKGVDFSLSGINGDPSKYWSLEKIKTGDQAKALKPMTEAKLRLLGRQSGPLRIYASQSGGAPMPQFPAPGRLWVPRVRFMEWEPSEDENSEIAGIVSVDVFKASRSENVQLTVASEYADYLEEWPIRRIQGVHGGVIEPLDRNGGGFTGASQGARQSLRLPGMSPIQMDSLSFSQNGFTGNGRVLPTVPLISAADIRILVLGDDVQLRKTFDLGELNIPAPFEVSEASLTAFYGDRSGLGLEGRIEFEINRLGKGFLGAGASTSGGFSLAGEFNFDERLFGEGTTAQVRVAYEQEQWSMGGTVTIPEGKVPGVVSATIEVNYSESEGFAASGAAELSVPGVESGRLAITHTEESGFVIGGEFSLSSETPGIRGGSVAAELREKPDGSGFAVSARGEAQPDIPGINSNLLVSYDDGAFTAEVRAAYSRGMLSGEVNAGVTNRTVNEDGTVAETAEPDNPLVVYGGGQLTLQLAPWLQGTAGVQFAPNGEITVTGEIGLPSSLEIFPRYEIDKSIFSIAVQVPLYPGIVAEIGGGLGAVAGIGPGELNQLSLGITYNPDQEENTRVTGNAQLSIPADAGLRLSVRAGIGLGITGASATGGLEIGGTMGFEGSADAAVQVEWTPAEGLDLNAPISVHAQPSFTFSVSGYVSVRALGMSVYDQTWELASVSFGSDYRLGISTVIRYKEGEPFDLSTDDIEFQVPSIDTNELLRGLVDRVA